MEGISDQQFELLVQEKRYNELISILKKILVNLNPEVDNSDITLILGKIVAYQSEIPKSISVIGNSIISKLDELTNKRNKDWQFNVRRDNEGLITNVVAKQI